MIFFLVLIAKVYKKFGTSKKKQYLCIKQREDIRFLIKNTK